jgi:transcriptional regulator of nitric oxide reductase
VAFSPLEGTPLHFRAYAVDPKVNAGAAPIGYAFWTTDVVPDERGYHGPIHFLVGLDPQGVLPGVVLDYDSEPYGYFSIMPARFVAQFAGKSVRAPFRLGQDIDAVSRATITMTSAVRAIRDSSRAMARQFLDPASVKP